MAVMNTLDLTGVSAESWNDAAHQALAEAAKTIRHINRMEIVDVSAIVQDSVIAEYHTHVRIYFEVER